MSLLPPFTVKLLSLHSTGPDYWGNKLPHVVRNCSAIWHSTWDPTPEDLKHRVFSFAPPSETNTRFTSNITNIGF